MTFSIRHRYILLLIFIPAFGCSEVPKDLSRDETNGADPVDTMDASSSDLSPTDTLPSVDSDVTEPTTDIHSDIPLGDITNNDASPEPDTKPDISDISHFDILDGNSDDSYEDAVDADTLAPLTCTPRALASGLAPGTNELMPGGTRLRAAVSTDGLTWTRLADPILDQAATPTLTRLPDGRPLLFMTAHKINGMRDGTAVAIGALDGRSWTHCTVELVGFPPGVLGSDPDVVALPEGGFRLFVTGSVGLGNPPPIGIHYADSTDGLRWVYGGIALTKSGGSLIDSMTFIHDGLWHMYTLTTTSIAMVHATSTDGKTFTIASEGELRIGNEPHVLSHATHIGFAHRIFGFGPRGETIRAFDIGSGGTLTGDSRALLSTRDGDQGDKLFVKDPAVTVLADGSYLMAYATAL